MSDSQTNKSLTRAIGLLTSLSNQPRTLTELSEIISIQPSGTLKVLRTFMEQGLVCRLPDGRYSLGHKCCNLARGFLKQNPLPQVALPILKVASKRYGARFILARLEGIEQVNLLIIDEVAGQSEELPVTVGPAWPQATGQVLLAFSAEQIVTEHMKKYPLLPGRITIESEGDFRAHLANIRTQGVAVATVPDVGIHMIAAPIVDHRGQVIAAVGRTARPHDSIELAKDSTLTAASEISRLIGAGQ